MKSKEAAHTGHSGRSSPSSIASEGIRNSQSFCPVSPDGHVNWSLYQLVIHCSFNQYVLDDSSIVCKIASALCVTAFVHV